MADKADLRLVREDESRKDSLRQDGNGNAPNGKGFFPTLNNTISLLVLLLTAFGLYATLSSGINEKIEREVNQLEERFGNDIQGLRDDVNQLNNTLVNNLLLLNREVGEIKGQMSQEESQPQ
jgi:hypothetical protein